MKQEIGKHEDMVLVERIILNGIVDDLDTHDDNGFSIGVADVKKIATFSGEEYVQEGRGFPLTKEMEDRLGWGSKYASVKFVTSDKPIDATKVDEFIIESYFGIASAEYYHRYSDYTGYLWTNEGFEVGGHDLYNIISSYRGQYIHLEIELFEDKKKR
jgi:hypothetical protein